MKTFPATIRIPLLLTSLVAVACGGKGKLKLGDGCVLNSDCTDPLSCKFGKCHRQCDETRDCAAGERCVKVDGIGVCQRADELACDGAGTCPSPLLCAAENQCRSACSVAGDCLDGQRCTSNVCWDMPAGGIPDAGSAGSGGAQGGGGGGAGGAGGAGPGTFDVDLVVHYSFAGHVRDQSGNGNHGTLAGAVTYAAGSTGDQAIVFDNPAGQVMATQWVEIPYSSGIQALANGSFSVVVTYRTTDSTGINGRLFGSWDTPIVLDYNATGVPYAFGTLGDGVTMIRFGGGGTVPKNPVVTTDGKFHTQAMIFDRTAAAAAHYVDGAETHALTNVQLGPLTLTGLVVGATRAADTYAAKATVDDFRIYRRALTAEEIKTLSRALVP